MYIKETIQKHSTNNTKTQYKQYKNTVQTIQNTVQTIQKHSTNNTKTQYKQYKTQYKQYKNTVQTIQNRVNTSTHITKTLSHYKLHTYTHPHITKQVKTTTVQNTHQMK